MKISYVVPCYNHELFLKDCLDSIKDDIFVESEIIIIDDGSKDRSVAIIKSWMAEHANLNVKLIEQKNSGVCATLNKLFELAKGEFIRPVSSDDILILGSTKNLLEMIENSPNYLMCFGDSQVIDSSGEVIASSHIEYRKKSIEKYKTNVKQAIIANWAVAGPSFLCKKEMLLSIGKYDESLLIEDWNMFLRLAAKDKLIFFPGPVAKYRIHSDNTSITLNKDKRISNLSSQLLGGHKNIEFYDGGYKILLRAQLELLKAKVAYLKKDFIATSYYLMRFAMGRVSAAFLLYLFR